MWWQDIGEEWLESIDTPEIIIIPGNHDFLFEQYQHKLDQLIPKLKNKIIHIVTNDVITTKHTNLKVLCNSWTPYFLSWAFNGPENPIDAQEFFDKMYDKFTNQTVDIVATHGPPKSVLDITNRNQQSVGCAELGRLVKLIKPKYHIFGHIHEARGAKVDDSGLIHYINTACVVNSIVL
jgi:Icc-related predicted phosphoesterase